MKRHSLKNREPYSDDNLNYTEGSLWSHDSMFFERSPQSGSTVPHEGNHSKSVTSQLKELQFKFFGRGEVRGFEFEQILKNDWGYLYKVRQEGLPEYYEVFKRVENSLYNCISYPGASSFGITAWTCKRIEDAMIRFNATIQKEIPSDKLPLGTPPEVQDLLSLFDDM